MRDDPYASKWGPRKIRRQSVRQTEQEEQTTAPAPAQKDTGDRVETPRKTQGPAKPEAKPETPKKFNRLMAAVNMCDRNVVASSGLKKVTIEVPEDLHELAKLMKDEYGAYVASVYRGGLILLAALTLGEENCPEDMRELLRYLRDELKRTVEEMDKGEGGITSNADVVREKQG